MNSARLRLEHLLNRRAGINEDYSIPEKTTFIERPSASRGREGRTDAGGCEIPRL